MQTTYQSETTAAAAAPAPGAFARSAFFAYGVVAYAIGVAGLMALILACLGVLTFSGGPLNLGTGAAAIAFNLGWVALFGVQHAIMARPGFKQRWRSALPEATERPTFVLLAGAIMSATIWLWQPLPRSIWSIDLPAAVIALRAVAVLGWAYLFAASFAINHFELFGLQQVWQTLRRRDITRPAFARRWMYRFDRHPIMSGMLIGLWVTPVMSLDRLLLALGFSVYIVVGVAIEERDLIRSHGESYRSYVREVKSLVPRLGLRV